MNHHDNVIELFPNAKKRATTKKEIALYYLKLIIENVFYVVRKTAKYLGIILHQLINAWIGLFQTRPFTALFILGFVIYLGQSRYESIFDKQTNSSASAEQHKLKVSH